MTDKAFNRYFAALVLLLFFILGMLVCSKDSEAQTYAPYINSHVQLFDNNGVACAGCLLYTYSAGTSSPATTYKDNLGTANTNPIVLDSSGSAVIYFGAQSYKLVLQSALNVPIWTQDNVSSTNLTPSVLNLSAQIPPSCTSGNYSIWADVSGKIRMCVNGAIDTVLGASGLSGSLASPPAIGGTTPNTGTFTQVNAAGTNSVGALAAQGPWSTVSNPSTAIWPALLTLPNGHLYALFMGSGGTTISSSLSTDGGQSWTVGSGPTIPGGDSVDYASMTLLQNGTVFLAYSVANSSTLAAQPGYIIGTVSGDVITWGSYNQITITGRSYCYDPSSVVQLSNGNLLLPVWCQANANLAYSALDSGIVISTNGGSTWSAFNVIGGSISVTGSSTNGYDESCMALMPSGDVVDILRHTNPGDPNGTFARSVSSNGGTTWSAPVETGIVNNNTVGRPTCLVSGNQLIMAARMGIGPIGSQTGGTVSSDEGVTWTTPTLLERGSAIDEYDALTTFGGVIGMVSSLGTTGAYFSTLTLNGLTAPNGGSVGQLAATNIYAQNIAANGLSANFIPQANGGGLLSNSPLSVYSNGFGIIFGPGTNNTNHRQIYLPDRDSLAGYPRFALNDNGANILCVGDDTAGDFVVGTCGGLPNLSWISQRFAISQAGGVGIPGLAPGGPVVADNSGNLGTAGAWTQTNPTPTCGSGTLTTATSTLRASTQGKFQYINYALSITTVGTCAGAITVPLPNAVKSISSLSCSDNNTLPPVLGSSTINAGGTSLFIGKYDGTTFAASGRAIGCTGVIELQ